MKIYKNSYYTYSESSMGFEFFTRRDKAERAMRKFLKDLDRDEDGTDSDIEVIEIQPTRAGILRALRLHAAHPDNS